MRRQSRIEVRREIDLVESIPCRMPSVAQTQVRRGALRPYLPYEGMKWALSIIVDWKSIDWSGRGTGMKSHLQHYGVGRFEVVNVASSCLPYDSNVQTF
jgi:hypothetical protein